jgi:hypothetical protein
VTDNFLIYLLEKLTSSQLAKKFVAFYGTRRFINAFTTARHLPVPILSQLDTGHAPTLHFLNTHLNISLLYMPGFFQLVSFPQVSPPKLCIAALDYVIDTLLSGKQSSDVSVCRTILRSLAACKITNVRYKEILVAFVTTRSRRVLLITSEI